MGEINPKIAFIGCGAMGEAILKGMLLGNVASESDIALSVPSQKSQDRLRASYPKAAVYGKNEEAVQGADLVILAVKPQMAHKAVTAEMLETLPKEAAILSIMGSFDLAKLHALVPAHAVIRAMPNTPLAVGMGMTALTADDAVTEDMKAFAGTIFNSCGETIWVDESAMEAITAISGCGPGYFFVVMDALADAGVMAGLPRALAIKLAAATMAGSGMMGLKTGLHPAQLRDQESELKSKREEAEKKWEEDAQKSIHQVTVEDIADVVSMTTGVPVSNLTEAETEKLLRMEAVLHERVVGQEEAVTALSKAIRRSRSGLKDPKRPAGSFIFLGPSGVGKTELSKALAEFLFNSEDALLSFDMSEYMEKHSVSRLVGSPPGYVGFDEGGQLTKAVRQRPYSVVLFDEIEKAHPDVFNILLQILEEGRLTDAQGRTVDFRNAVIIMTSNVGAREIAEPTTLGFSVEEHAGLSDKEIKSRVMAEMKKLFRPEFLNRIDEIIVFKSLNDEQIEKIVELMVADLRERLIEQNMTINLTEAARKLIAKEGTDATFGARPLRRAIQRLLEDPLSEEILEGMWTSGSVIDVDAVDGELVFSAGSGSIPAPRKRDSIAREAELLLTNYDLGHAGVTGGGSMSGGAAD